MWVSREKWKELEDRLWRLEYEARTCGERLDAYRGEQLDLTARIAACETVDVPPYVLESDYMFPPTHVCVPRAKWAALVNRALRIIGTPGGGPSVSQQPEPATKKGRE